MATKLHQMRAKDENMQVNLEHQRRLLDALKPEPAAWEYRDEVVECGGDEPGQCACGHPIRYGFPIYHKNQFGFEETKMVGSTCVHHFAQISQETFLRLCAAQERLSAQIKEDARIAREAQQQAEVETARAAFEKAIEKAHGFYNSYSGWKPYFLWALINKPSKVVGLPEYKRTSDYIRWYKKQTERINKEIDAFDTPMTPVQGF